MLRNLLMTLGFMFCCSLAAQAQLGKIPATVTDAFAKQYPGAVQVAYSENLSDYAVSFRMDTVSMVARYNGKGEWRSTERSISLTALPADVKDGFTKSKYSDWNVLAVHQLQLPESQGGEQYRIRVGKGEVKKRQLVFSVNGRLLRDRFIL